jgi:site-specific DNA-methyltransferase (adenine-specific)
MARSGARTATPSVHTTVRTAGSTLSFYQADCLDVFAALPSASISVIVTSPPYNLGIDYRSYDDSRPRAEYLQWTEIWTAAAARVLEPEGSLFLNLGAKPTDPWTAMDIAQAARKCLHLQNTIHWIKSIAIDKDAAGAAAGLERDLAVGHYKPINSPRFLNDCHEFIFHFTPSGRTPLDRRGIGVEYQDASNIGRWRSGGANRRCRGNAWFIPYDTIKSRDKDRPHPATFPPRLAEYCLRLHGREHIRTAMDPFLGLGSAAVAAVRLEVDFIGVEIDGDYLGASVRRVNDELNEQGLFETPAPRRRRRPRAERKA